MLILLIIKDLRLLVRDAIALLLLFLAPILVIAAAGFSLSTLYRSERHLLPLTDLDGDEIARTLVATLREAPELEVVEVGVDEARRLVADTPRAGAALVIPEGYPADDVVLQLWTDPVKHLEVLKIQAAVERANAGIMTSRVASRIAVVEVLTYAGETVDLEALAEDAAMLASRLLEKNSRLEEASVYGGATTFNTFDQNVPGFGLTFLLLGMLFGVGLGILDEREWGTMYRLAAGPVSKPKLVVGKMLSRFLMGLVQMTVLFAVGRLAFDISLGRSLVALALVVVAVTFASASLGLLAASLAPSRDSVLPMGTIGVVVMAAIGGCWWPITIEPLWLQRLAHVFPTAWAMGAFNDLMLRERALVEVVPSLIALLGFGALYLVFGARLFRRAGGGV
ncbi:MAG TPA: ABC transporter permease [Vicinamibacteria bacterium]|nr:ABC transporter permease [Vicinamibacteria bacterium]